MRGVISSLPCTVRTGGPGRDSNRDLFINPVVRTRGFAGGGYSTREDTYFSCTCKYIYYIYVCVCVCVYDCMYVYAYMYICMYMYICVCIICMFIYVCMYVDKGEFTCVHIHSHVLIFRYL
jgi:hypothetical protein